MTALKPSKRLTRDGVMFVAGLGLLGHETLITAGERPTLIIAALGLMGLPVFLHSDESVSKKLPSNDTAVKEALKDGET